MAALVFCSSKASLHAAPGGHPERQERLTAILNALSRAGMHSIEAEPAGIDQLLSVHSAEQIERLESFCKQGGGWIDPDTYATEDSFEAARHAAGASIMAAENALEGRKALCAVRPPGHHASRDRAMGFCLLNNIAVGAAHALRKGARRVAIVDIDVHHGNGTQDIFYEDGDVLFISLHQWPWYPWSDGDMDRCGLGDGLGKNVNIPLPAGSGDDVYLEAIDLLVAPIVREFDPELLMISFGFDAHEADPLSLQLVTTAGFVEMTSRLSSLAGEICGGRVAGVLEGGYALPVLPECVTGVLAALESPRTPPVPSKVVRIPASPTLAEALSFQRGHWSLS